MTNDNRCPVCPRCAAMGSVDPQCPICEMLRQLPPGTPVAMGMVVSSPAPPPTGLPRFLMRLLPTLVGAVVSGIGASTMAWWLGASELVQFGVCLVGALGGMLGVALLTDHISGRRRLWARRLPPVPPRASMPEQIPGPRNNTT